MKRDPIELFEARLAEQGVLSAEAAKEVHEEIARDVEAAIDFAKASPMPDPDALLDDVYA
jgi:pyruvate dehydrogenase E1 component alpha subunit